jgi:hypothetical protein
MAKKMKRAKRGKMSPRILTDDQINALQETDGLNGRYISARITGEQQWIWIRLDAEDRKQAIAQLRKAGTPYAGTLGNIVQMDH